jgi:glycosyltransferase involved in cell wall biosynthesis
MQSPLNRLNHTQAAPADARRYRVPGRIVCLVDAAWPFSSGVDATRTQAIASALHKHNHSVIVMSPAPADFTGAPGFDADTLGKFHENNGVRYIYLPDCAIADGKLQADLSPLIENIKTGLRIFKPGAVLIAAGQSWAFAAAIAARELGLPIFYEIREVPENRPDQDNDQMDTAIAAIAEQVLTGNAAVLQQRGGKAKKMVWLPTEPPPSGQSPDWLSGISTLLANTWHKKIAAAALSQLRRLRMAAVMDDFTWHSYAPECNLLQLTPEHAISELESFKPELLFIESAWRGKDGLWDRKIGTLSHELKDVLAWCKARRIPTMFWNKEDPIHFESFLTTANQFDYVFTTDIDCISRYKAALKHDNVFLLPFASQPKTHNPVEIYRRKDAFCFAGAYYVRYPERIKDLENYISELPQFRKVEIFDRNFGKNDPNYQFPPLYQPYIVGTLPFNEIDKAYKGYRYSINLNSIKQSQSMYARRVYELLASNTVTVSNFSRGIRLMFGDLVITTDNGGEMMQRLKRLANDTETADKLRLAALRKVMQEHTYARRLAYIASKALKIPMADALPAMLAVACVNTQAELVLLIGHFQRQTHPTRRMLLLCMNDFVLPPQTDSRIKVINRSATANFTLAWLLQEGEWIAPMLAQDYYGPNYLLDLAITTCYSEVKLAGKAAYYQSANGTVSLQHADCAYRAADRLAARASAMAGSLLAQEPLLPWLANLATTTWQYQPNLAIDPYNYCRDGSIGSEIGAIQQKVDDLKLDVGISIDRLQGAAEQIKAQVEHDQSGRYLKASQFAAQFGNIVHPLIRFGMVLDRWRVQSDLPEGKHEYLFAPAEVTLAELNATHELKTHLEMSPGLNVTLVINFLNAEKQKIHFAILTANTNHTTAVPPETKSVRLGLRVYGNGEADIKAIKWGHFKLEPATLLGQGQHLILTNQYPSYDDLYRNGFVHSRVRAYRNHDVRADVFCLKSNETLNYREFQDIDNISGDQSALEKLLAAGHYQSVLVHFLTPAMWEVLKKFVGKVRILVWMHGAEVQPWYRRDFNYNNEQERDLAKRQSAVRMAFWSELFGNLPEGIRFIFVSHYFAEEVMEDVGIRLPHDRYEIVHNPIDTDLFNHVPKPAEQRKKILSIRPYASAKYANDLSVKAILALSAKPFFHELEFRMIGDGPMFDDILAPLRGMSNVIIERRFLSQPEIAQLHKEYGIFLNPTRMDAQGVSRDESMSSGLVPITNAVAAIPEFVNDSCGILVPAEDFAEMALGIETLLHDPELFLAMSAAAAKRVRSQSSALMMTTLELNLINHAPSQEEST